MTELFGEADAIAAIVAACGTLAPDKYAMALIDALAGPACYGMAVPPTGDGHKYASVQFDMPEEVAERIALLAAKVRDGDLAEEGREGKPHLTVKYGLRSDDPSPVLKAASGHDTVRLRLGRTAFFPDSGSGDVVYLTVENAGQLRRLNRDIADACPHADTRPAYRPHVTLAYVKPGRGELYADDDTLAGLELAFDELTFSPADGDPVTLPIGGGDAGKAAGGEPERFMQWVDTGPGKRPGGTGKDRTWVDKDPNSPTYNKSRVQISRPGSGNDRRQQAEAGGKPAGSAGSESQGGPAGSATPGGAGARSGGGGAGEGKAGWMSYEEGEAARQATTTAFRQQLSGMDVANVGVEDAAKFVGALKQMDHADVLEVFDELGLGGGAGDPKGIQRSVLIKAIKEHVRSKRAGDGETGRPAPAARPQEQAPAAQAQRQERYTPVQAAKRMRAAVALAEAGLREEAVSLVHSTLKGMDREHVGQVAEGVGVPGDGDTVAAILAHVKGERLKRKAKTAAQAPPVPAAPPVPPEQPAAEPLVPGAPTQAPQPKPAGVPDPVLAPPAGNAPVPATPPPAAIPVASQPTGPAGRAVKKEIKDFTLPASQALAETRRVADLIAKGGAGQAGTGGVADAESLRKAAAERVRQLPTEDIKDVYDQFVGGAPAGRVSMIAAITDGMRKGKRFDEKQGVVVGTGPQQKPAAAATASPKPAPVTPAVKAAAAEAPDAKKKLTNDLLEQMRDATDPQLKEGLRRALENAGVPVPEEGPVAAASTPRPPAAIPVAQPAIARPPKSQAPPAVSLEDSMRSAAEGGLSFADFLERIGPRAADLNVPVLKKQFAVAAEKHGKPKRVAEYRSPAAAAQPAKTPPPAGGEKKQPPTPAPAGAPAKPPAKGAYKDSGAVPPAAQAVATAETPAGISPGGKPVVPTKAPASGDERVQGQEGQVTGPGQVVGRQGGTEAEGQEEEVVRPAGGDRVMENPISRLQYQRFASTLAKATHLTPEQREHYGSQAKAVFGNMSDGALRRFAAGASNQTQFHASPQKLRESIAATYRKAGRERDALAIEKAGAGTAGMYVGNSKKGKGYLILDGDQEKPGFGEFSTSGGAADVYAHEFAHAIDGPQLSMSTSPAWKKAWAAEVDRADSPLTKYARKNAAEGFAEFGRLALSGRFDDAQLEQAFPLCHAFWKSNDLLADQGFVESTAPAGTPVKPPEMFDGERRVQLDGANHADVLLRSQEKPPQGKPNATETGLQQQGDRGQRQDGNQGGKEKRAGGRDSAVGGGGQEPAAEEVRKPLEVTPEVVSGKSGPIADAIGAHKATVGKKKLSQRADSLRQSGLAVMEPIAKRLGLDVAAILRDAPSQNLTPFDQLNDNEKNKARDRALAIAIDAAEQKGAKKS